VLNKARHICLFISLVAILHVPQQHTSFTLQNTHYVLQVTNLPFCSTQYKNTGLFEMTVGVLTACHTQYTSDSNICIFYLI